jgi:hypothetical protein
VVHDRTSRTWRANWREARRATSAGAGSRTVDCLTALPTEPGEVEPAGDTGDVQAAEQASGGCDGVHRQIAQLSPQWAGVSSAPSSGGEELLVAEHGT